MDNERTIQTFDLSLPYAPNRIELMPPDSTAHGGASIAHVSAGFAVTSLAYFGQAAKDVLTLFLNEEYVNEVTIAEGEEAKDMTLTIPPDLFQKGYNSIKFRVRRTSGNEEFSKELILLYRSSPPGDTPPVLAIQVSHESIGGDEADNVTVTVAYKNIQWYDRIFVDCNGVLVRYQLLPDSEPPASAPPQNIIIPIPRETLEQGGDDSDFTFKFRVSDQMNNPSGPPTWSDIVNADVHLDRLTLGMAILREILTENDDDPKIVHLAKLNGNPLLALIHLVETIWKVGDSIKLLFTAELNGSVVATHEETSPIAQVPSQFIWSVPNDKIIANSIVKVVYQLVRGGALIATSTPATAQVNGEGAPEVEVSFTNAPFTVAPSGQVKDIKLSLTQAGLPVSGTITIELPAGTTFKDGSTGPRDFITEPDGTLTISDVKGATAPGSYALTASSGRQVETAVLTVNAHGPVGPIQVGVGTSGIAVTRDGTRVYAVGPSTPVIDTASSTLIRQIPVAGAWGLDLNKDGSRAYACTGSSLSVIDTERYALITNIPGVGYPIEVVLSQDGKFAFVSNWSSSATVSVYDLVNLQHVKTIPVGASPRGIVISPDGTRIYVCSEIRSISVIDAQAHTFIRAVPIKGSYSWELAITPDGASVYVCSSGGIQQLDTNTWIEIRTISVPGFPRSIVVNHAGTQAYFCDRDANTVSTIDTASGAVINTTRVGQGPISIVISPDDARAYVACVYDNTVWCISLESRAASAETENAGLATVTSDSPREPIPGDIF